MANNDGFQGEKFYWINAGDNCFQENHISPVPVETCSYNINSHIVLFDLVQHNAVWLTQLDGTDSWRKIHHLGNVKPQCTFWKQVK